VHIGTIYRIVYFAVEKIGVSSIHMEMDWRDDHISFTIFLCSMVSVPLLEIMFSQRKGHICSRIT
jgi:hypothetical protein